MAPTDNGGSLVISIKAFTEDVAAGFDNVAAKSRQWAGSVKDSFAGVNAVSNQTSAALVADTNAAAEGVTVAWRRVAEATVEYRQAQREVRNASRDSIALAAGEEGAVNRLAVAKQRLAVATEELATASKAAVPAEEAESAALAGMGEVLGPLIEGALLLEFVNHLKESTMETAHLAEATGINVVRLVELKDAMHAFGATTDRLPQQLTKLSKAILDASEGNKTAQHEFHQLGIETDNWKGKSIDAVDVLLQMAHHLQDGTMAEHDFAIASKLMGKEVSATVAFLRQGDEAIRKQLSSYRAHGEAVAGNIEAARQFERTEEQLKISLETGLLPAFKLVTITVQSAVAGFYYAKAGLEIFGRQILLLAQDIYTAMQGVGQVQSDLIQGNFRKASQDAKASLNEIVGADRVAVADINKTWADAQGEVDKIFALLPEEVKKAGNSVTIEDQKTAKSRISIWQEALNQQKLAADAFHDVTLKDELAYWEQIKTQHKLTRQEQLSVDNEILRLRKGITKQTFDDEISKMNLALAATKSGSQQRIALLQNDLIQLRNEGKQETAAYKEKEKELTEAKKQYAEERNRISQQLNLEEAQFEEKIALLQLQARKDAFGAEVTAHHKKDKDVLQQEKEFAAEEHRIIVAGLNAKLKVLQKDPTLNVLELKRLHNELLIEDQRFSNELNKIQEKSVNRRRALEQSVAQGMKSSMSSAVTGLITQTQTLSQAFEQMGQAILSSFVDSLSQMVTAFIEREILMKVFHLTTEKEKAASGIASSAAEAGAAGVASWAGAPWPIDAGAPAFGASMFSTAMAYQGLAAFEKGGIVPSTGLAMVHKNERIIPEDISQRLVTNGGGAGGGITISPTLNASAMDTDGLVPVLNNFKRQLVRELKAAVANNRLNLKTS